ncbi:MAG: NAD(P)H-hydrate dehydratase [Campylobacterota bacterium]|nr:NAD(P)H-hydrate dehydratase [Campylobacterota bacterium]
MQNVYKEVSSLDQRCYKQFALSEDILMEHAASSMAHYIYANFELGSKILIACGPGNNGADGLALARQLQDDYIINAYVPFGLKSPMAMLQEKRAIALNVDIAESFYDDVCVIVDCLFGSGMNKPLDDIGVQIVNRLNGIECFKIACDIPTGINAQGMVSSICFDADVTITMGALKTQLYSDGVKDFVGQIVVANLGVARKNYEIPTNVYLLEESDMKLPFRTKKCSHKGEFGHLNVILGEKIGAGILCSEAAFAFGVGLVTTIGHKELSLPNHLMQAHQLSSNATAIAIGMGLGNHDNIEIRDILNSTLPKVIDADLLGDEKILSLLNKDNCVLTPHPKEFCALLKVCGLADISVKQCQEDRFKYIEQFTKKYPKVVLLLKGANTLIAHENKIYINAFGSAVLSQGGSGDVLSGLIGSLLAQGYSLLDATMSGSLAHGIASQNYTKNNYSMLPEDLIEQIKVLEN